MNNHNNADVIYQIVRGMGRRGLRTNDHPHAAKGGRSHPKEIRELVIQMIMNGGIQAVNTLEVSHLRLQKKFPCLATCRRWLHQHVALGHVRPKRANGNHFAQREVTGEALVQLAFYRVIRPHARLYEIKAYLSVRFPNIPPYSNSQIYRAEQRLGLTRKAASRTSQHAYLPRNLIKRRVFWENGYPLGVAGETTTDIIDIDEARFKMESTDRSFGKVARAFRCNLKSNYKKGEEGTNLLLAISGDNNNPFSFHRQFTEGGTDLFRFYCFMRDLLHFLSTNYPNRSFLFTMDNLNIHKYPVVLQLIHHHGHRNVFRAPYWSCDGAIEYVFNSIHTILEMNTETEMGDVHALVNRINLIIGSLGSFRRYFLHVGFQDN